MHTFLLSKFQVGHWLSTGVLALLTWPLLLAVSLAEQFGPPAHESDAKDARPANDRAAADHLVQFGNDHLTHGCFRRYRW